MSNFQHANHYANRSLECYTHTYGRTHQFTFTCAAIRRQAPQTQNKRTPLPWGYVLLHELTTIVRRCFGRVSFDEDAPSGRTLKSSPSTAAPLYFCAAIIKLMKYAARNRWLAPTAQPPTTTCRFAGPSNMHATPITANRGIFRIMHFACRTSSFAG